MCSWNSLKRPMLHNARCEPSSSNARSSIFDDANPRQCRSRYGLALGGQLGRVGTTERTIFNFAFAVGDVTSLTTLCVLQQVHTGRAHPARTQLRAGPLFYSTRLKLVSVAQESPLSSAIQGPCILFAGLYRNYPEQFVRVNEYRHGIFERAKEYRRLQEHLFRLERPMLAFLPSMWAWLSPRPLLSVPLAACRSSWRFVARGQPHPSCVVEIAQMA
jgi:hypothetical protein